MPSLLLFNLAVFSILVLTTCFSSAFPVARPAVKRGSKGFDVPIQRRTPRDLRRRDGVSGEIGLGDNSDLLYSVPIQLGPTVTIVNLDTGSSDLWVTSDSCTKTSCGSRIAPSYSTSTSSFNNSGSTVTMNYGDSSTGTSATGPIGFDTATLAGIAIDNQAFTAVSSTDNTVIQDGAAGIFGLGFPSGSDIQAKLTEAQTDVTTLTSSDAFLNDTYTYGPLLSRISMTNQLEDDIFSIYLQRSEIDVGVNNGTLTIGKLPDGIDESSLTWVPVRLYAPADGGLNPPSFAPNEIYPFRWEVPIDGVYLDGQLLPNSTIPATGGVDTSQISALIDTGNSLIRGPTDVVNDILTTVSPNYNPKSTSSIPSLPCTAAHTLSFQIGGKMFPIDPRDFISDEKSTDTTTCEASNVVSTDPPGVGALFSWSLGDPFMKSTLVAFHYGNLTNPSADPPMIGFLSMVPDNADALLTQAVDNAQTAGGFQSTDEVAPTASAAAEAVVTVVPTTPASSTSSFAAPSASVTVSTGSSGSSGSSSSSSSSSESSSSSGSGSSSSNGSSSNSGSSGSKSTNGAGSLRLGGSAPGAPMGISVILGMGVALVAMVFT